MSKKKREMNRTVRFISPGGEQLINDNWIVKTLETALQGWNDKLTEMWGLLSQSPETFKGGDVWQVILTIHNAMQGIGYGLLVLFFAIGIFQTAASFQDIQRPEYALRHLIRFIAAKVAVGSSMEIILAIFNICGGIIRTAMSGMGGMASVSASLPAELVTAIDEVGFLASIPLWLAAFLGFLVITVLSFILILTVYGRFFKIYLFAALAPLPLASFAGEGTSAMGKAFIKSYIGVCMEGAVIVLACLIYTAFLSSSSPAVDPSLPVTTMAFQYIGQMVFNMLVLTGLVKGSDRIAKEMFGL